MEGFRIRKICVVMLGILGDVLTRTPTVRELRKIFPGARIVCIVDPIGFEALQNSPDINGFQVVTRSKKSRYQYLKSKAQIWAHLLIHSYDLFVDLYGNSSTKLMAKLANSKMEIIIADGQVKAKNLQAKIETLPYPNQHHLSNVSLQALKYFWSEGVSLQTRPVVDLKSRAMSETERKYIDSLLARHKQFFIVSAGSGDVKKMIAPELCPAISKFMLERAGATPFLLHNPGKRDIQSEIAILLESAGFRFEKLIPLSLPAVIYLIQRALLVVVSDSGILHLTVAVGVPFLGIFPHTPPQEVVPVSGIFEVCFKPDPSRKPYGFRGLVYGVPEISEVEVLQHLSILVNRIEARGTSVPNA